MATYKDMTEAELKVAHLKALSDMAQIDTQQFELDKKLNETEDTLAEIRSEWQRRGVKVDLSLLHTVLMS